jgi:hypothetical protein
MSAAAVIVIRRKRLARRFRDAGATNPEHAVTLATLGERPCWIFGQMVRHGVFVTAAGGRYYMDERAAVAFFRRQQVRALTMTAVLVLLFLLLWLSGLLGH